MYISQVQTEWHYLLIKQCLLKLVVQVDAGSAPGERRRAMAQRYQHRNEELGVQEQVATSNKKLFGGSWHRWLLAVLLGARSYILAPLQKPIVTNYQYLTKLEKFANYAPLCEKLFFRCTNWVDLNKFEEVQGCCNVLSVSLRMLKVENATGSAVMWNRNSLLQARS